jgi:hypothetical protein
MLNIKQRSNRERQMLNPNRTKQKKQADRGRECESGKLYDKATKEIL